MYRNVIQTININQNSANENNLPLFIAYSNFQLSIFAFNFAVFVFTIKFMQDNHKVVQDIFNELNKQIVVVGESETIVSLKYQNPYNRP